jgi:hypothetical protein
MGTDYQCELFELTPSNRPALKDLPGKIRLLDPDTPAVGKERVPWRASFPMPEQNWILMNETLSDDELEALVEIGPGSGSKKVTPKMAKHAKHLLGLKLISFVRDGRVTITDAGRQTLFLKQCIDGLRKIAVNPDASLHHEVLTFLARKGHIAIRPEGGYGITTKGQETLADMDARR